MYADTFVFGSSALYNVSVRFISDIYDETRVYYLGLAALTDVIMVCFLSSAEHYYTSREIAMPIIEEHAPLLEHQQDMATATLPEADICTYPVSKNTTKHPEIQELHTYISPEHPATIDIGSPIQNEVIPYNCLQKTCSTKLVVSDRRA